MMVGLTGGVGAGKSAVAALLAEHGAVIIDADQIAREVVEPGTPGSQAVVARFGPGVLAAEGTLDRAGLAAIVFADPAALADLNAIVHPLVRRRTDELKVAAPAGAIVVNEVPLLAEGTYKDTFDLIVVVEAAMAIRLQRLAQRGLPADQARARIAAQATDEQRRAIADRVIVNDGTRDELAAEVGRVWVELRARAGQI
jgi:dephospho-CoA kinase